MEKKLSVILTGRNDNYGGDFNARLYNTLHWLHYWLTRYNIPSEIVLVNYNPLPHRPAIYEMVEFPKMNDRVCIRVIDVPPEEHEKILHADVRKPVPLIEFVAKNIGIRRARGSFVLATNADVLFDPGIFACIAHTPLQHNAFYRAARVDFRSESPLVFHDNPNLLLEKIRKSVFRFFLQGGTYDDNSRLPFVIKLRYLQMYNWLRGLFFKAVFPLRGILRHLGIPHTNELFTFRWFCNAGGDFMLMSKEAWMAGRGYPEDTWISTHTDSLHLVMTAVSGLRQVTFPYVVYHQEHDRRFDFGAYNADMELMYSRLVSEGNEMVQFRKSLNNNPENWGLGDVTLNEITI
ncbi:MAG: hypothetical protein NZM35_04350 [Chitinophagales bacterium]|nr:hypothetical protein [Chitinophagales bacterium]MDW8418679.1 hypothetical protein [Chitinophagales bacterium]